MDYKTRSQRNKLEAEESYRKAQKATPPQPLRIGGRVGTTGRYQVLSSDGGITSQGDKTFNASIPDDGFVRGTVAGNGGVAVDHRNYKRVEKRLVDEVQTVSNVKTLYTKTNTETNNIEIYIGGDRDILELIYALPQNIEGFFLQGERYFRLDNTGTGADDWILNVAFQYVNNISVGSVPISFKNFVAVITSDSKREIFDIERGNFGAKLISKSFGSFISFASVFQDFERELGVNLSAITSSSPLFAEAKLVATASVSGIIRGSVFTSVINTTLGSFTFITSGQITSSGVATDQITKIGANLTLRDVMGLSYSEGTIGYFAYQPDLVDGFRILSITTTATNGGVFSISSTQSYESGIVAIPARQTALYVDVQGEEILELNYARTTINRTGTVMEYSMPTLLGDAKNLNKTAESPLDLLSQTYEILRTNGVITIAKKRVVNGSIDEEFIVFFDADNNETIIVGKTISGEDPVKRSQYHRVYQLFTSINSNFIDDKIYVVGGLNIQNNEKYTDTIFYGFDVFPFEVVFRDNNVLYIALQATFLSAEEDFDDTSVWQLFTEYLENVDPLNPVILVYELNEDFEIVRVNENDQTSLLGLEDADSIDAVEVLSSAFI